MSKAAPSTRWFSGWRAPAAPPASDPADYGTAFGLDLSLNEPPAAAGAKQPRRGWMQRLVARGAAATTKPAT